jgi:hypothetical protein
MVTSRLFCPLSRSGPKTDSEVRAWFCPKKAGSADPAVGPHCSGPVLRCVLCTAIVRDKAIGNIPLFRLVLWRSSAQSCERASLDAMALRPHPDWGLLPPSRSPLAVPRRLLAVRTKRGRTSTRSSAAAGTLIRTTRRAAKLQTWRPLLPIPSPATPDTGKPNYTALQPRSVISAPTWLEGLTRFETRQSECVPSTLWSHRACHFAACSPPETLPDSYDVNVSIVYGGMGIQGDGHLSPLLTTCAPAGLRQGEAPKARLVQSDPPHEKRFHGSERQRALSNLLECTS